jgi:hypothetical protein
VSDAAGDNLRFSRTGSCHHKKGSFPVADGLVLLFIQALKNTIMTGEWLNSQRATSTFLSSAW